MVRRFGIKGTGRTLWEVVNIFRLVRLPWFMSFFAGTILFFLVSNLITRDYGHNKMSTISAFSKWFISDSKTTLQTTPPPLEEPMPHFSKKEIKNIVKTVDDFLSSFIDKLTNIRTLHMKALQNLPKDTWNMTPETTDLLDADSHKFLTRIRSLQILQTITINISLNDFFQKLPWTGYAYGGNDCGLIESKSEYGNNAHSQNGGYAKRYYKSSCLGNVTALTRQIPFEKSLLDIGYLPLLRPRIEEFKPVVALTYLHVAKNAIIHMDGDVFFNKYKLVPQRCMPGKFAGGKPEYEEILSLHEEVFTIAQFWGEGFFHFMNEEIPRLAAWVKFLQQNPRIKIHLNTVLGFMPPVFQALGLNPERLISGDVRAQVVYVPAGTPCGAQTYFNTKLLSLRLQANVISKPNVINYNTILLNDTLINVDIKVSKKNDSAYLHSAAPLISGAENSNSDSNKKSANSRNYIVVIKRSTKRYFAHHDEIFREIIKLANDFSLTVRLFDDQMLPEYKHAVEMFHNAIAVVGPHGAGLSNLFYSQPGTIVIEGLCYHDGLANLCYRNLAKSLGLRYFGVLLEDDCLEIKANDIVPPLRKLLVQVNIGKSQR